MLPLHMMEKLSIYGRSEGHDFTAMRKRKIISTCSQGTLTVDDLVTEIKDASETSSGIVSCEQEG